MTSSVGRQVHGCVALFILASLLGCGDGEANSSARTAPHGPHGGHTAEMSADADFEIEFTLDEKRRRLVLYVQALGVSTPYPLPVDSLTGRFEAGDLSVEATFAADPRPSDPEDHASRFALASDRLPQQLLASDQFVLKLSLPSDGGIIIATIPHKNDHGHAYHHD